MGNLVRPYKKVLINTVDAETVTAITGGVMIKNYGNLLLADLENCMIDCYSAGVKKVIVITVEPLFPCDECKGYNGGFALEKVQKPTGKVEDFMYNNKYYGYSLEALQTAVGGLLALADRETIAAFITYMIGTDPSALANVTQYSSFSYAAGNITLDIRDKENAILESHTGANVAAVVASIAGSDYISVYSSDADDLVIQSIRPGVSFRTSTTNLTLNGVHIGLEAKSALIPFDVHLDANFGRYTVAVVGSEPTLPYTKVAQIFPKTVDDIGTARACVVKDGQYCHYQFTFKKDAYSHSFASHMDNYIQGVDFYLLEAYANGANWKDKLEDAGLLDNCIGYVESSLASESASETASDSESEDDQR